MVCAISEKSHNHFVQYSTSPSCFSESGSQVHVKSRAPMYASTRSQSSPDDHGLMSNMVELLAMACVKPMPLRCYSTQQAYRPALNTKPSSSCKKTEFIICQAPEARRCSDLPPLEFPAVAYCRVRCCLTISLAETLGCQPFR